ncbi:MAG: hypothetical protein R2713_09120 [Ilumatobacteraceae bacterium]
MFDTLLDEQSILDAALGAGVSGLPIPEIQYLRRTCTTPKDQLAPGEAASLSFFSRAARTATARRSSRRTGPARRASAVTSTTTTPSRCSAACPASACASPGHPSDAARCCAAAWRRPTSTARWSYLEPIARYHTRDLHTTDDGQWTPYVAPAPAGAARVRRSARVGSPARVTTSSSSRGPTGWLYLSLRRLAARRAGRVITCVRLRWPA